MKDSEKVIEVGTVVRVAGTKTNSGRGNAVGVVREVRPGGALQVEAGIQGYGLCLVHTHRRDCTPVQVTR